MKTRFSWLALALALPSAASASTLQDSLIANIQFMRNAYDVQYAPAAWKRAHAGWDLQAEYARAVEAAQSRPDLSVQDARRILMNFVYSMKDYHVSIRFQSTEKATLPFIVKSVGDRFYIVDIDRSRLPEESFPFQAGDELVSLDGVPTLQVVRELQAVVTENVPTTDRMLAEMRLTARPASRGYAVPKGPVTVGIRRQGEERVSYHQLIWDYTPERVRPRDSAKAFNASAPSRLLHPMMTVDFDARTDLESPYDLGGRKSFIPALGTRIWESAADEPFHAYMYKGEDRRIIGVIRIPSYEPENTDQALASFARTMGMFEAATDALVIDQVNNPGGSVFYLYALASMLTDKPLATPRHEMTITPADVVDSLKNLETLSQVKDDASAKKVLGPTLDGYPMSYEVSRFLVGYFQTLVSEWNAGRRITQPYWIAGVDHINPAPAGSRYTKPILLLTNGLDFSGGDFFPAILQDNGRVTILGTRTAGAGGYVNDVTYPNDLGVEAFRVTGSLAHRLSSNPIENLGVIPDLVYELTDEDVTQGYAGYLRAIRSAVNDLAK